MAAEGEQSGPPVAATAADERALLTRLREGDAAAYESLVHAHGGRLLALARRLLGNEEDARDVVQETLLAAFRSLGGFKGEARLSTWLHRIAANAALMKLRSRRRRPESSIEDLLPSFGEDGQVLEPPREWSDGSERLLENKETREFVRRCIDELPDSYRTVLLLRDIEELDTAETASLLGISSNAVKIRLHRARLALRSLLDARFVRGGA